MASDETPLISIIIPMHNEAEGVVALFNRLVPCVREVTEDFEILCVDDGSTDSTLSELENCRDQDERIRIISLSRNFGKEAALTAGLDYARGMAVIPFDADLQDPPELIADMVAEWKKGAKVVLATRSSRSGDSWLKSKSARLFYHMMNRLSTVTIPPDTGDFRLMDREVAEAVRRLPERTRFMKGLFAWVGYSTVTLYFDRDKRYCGNSRWSYWSLWKFALDGIFSFTTVPLRIWTYIGGLISLGSFIAAAYIILRTIIYGVDVPGYASLMVVVLFMGGVQLLSLGIIGEYVGRIYRETKQRPIYVVRARIGLD